MKLDERDVERLLGRLAKLHASNRDPSGKPDPAFERVIASATILRQPRFTDTITLLIDSKSLPRLAAAARKDVLEQLAHEGYLWLVSHKIPLSLYHLGKLRPWYRVRTKLTGKRAEKLFRTLGIPLTVNDET